MAFSTAGRFVQLLYTLAHSFSLAMSRRFTAPEICRRFAFGRIVGRLGNPSLRKVPSNHVSPRLHAPPLGSWGELVAACWGW